MGDSTNGKLARGTLPDLKLSDLHVPDRRALIYSRMPGRMRWIENELARSGTPVISAGSVGQLVSILLDDTQRPQIVVIDLDALTAGELFQLHRIREHGWGGTLLALGRVPLSLRSSLGIDRTLPPPYTEDALCDEVTQHFAESRSTTTPIPLL